MRTAPHLLQIRQARGFWQRLLGLMGRARPADGGQALLLTRCTSVHTCFMRYALDIVYLDAQGRIVRLRQALPPWRCSWAGSRARNACHVLELPAGACASLGLQPGQQLQPWPPDADGTGSPFASARFVPAQHAGNARAPTTFTTGDNASPHPTRPSLHSRHP